MDTVIVGSELTRSMLEDGHKNIWCAVSDESDENALEDQVGNDFTSRIVAFEDGQFYCTSGMPWKYAVPIEIVALTRYDFSLQ